MSKISAAQLLEYTQVYVRDVFADLLRQEGFTSLDGDDVCWYRVVNKEVVNSICFYTHWYHEPVSLEVGYGIHPLFIPPFQNPKVHLTSQPGSCEVMDSQQLICKEGGFGRVYYSPNTPVYMPWGEDRGLHTLESILIPQMNSIQTVVDCYKMHKDRYLNSGAAFEQIVYNLFSADFIDEGILVEDKELYPYFWSWIDHKRQIIGSFNEKQRARREIRNLLHQMQIQEAVLATGNREAFLADLEQRKDKVIKMMNKKMKIVF